MVSFKPSAAGRSSTAVSVEDGSYRIRYDREFGAIVGEHEVRISTYRGPNGDFPGRAELIPMKYNSKTELIVDVESGHQVIDFELEDVPGEKKTETKAAESQLRRLRPLDRPPAPVRRRSRHHSK